MRKTFLLISMLILSACGYKGDLYLPKENDKNQFGVIQTGIDFKRPNVHLRNSPTSSEKNQNENH